MMLRVRQLIPSLTLLTAQGLTVRAWDFKQKKNLVIVFLDKECTLCDAFIGSLTSHAKALREKEAVMLLVFPQGSSLALSKSLPSEIIAGSDVGGSGTRLFFGEDEVSARDLHRRGVFITDRYGELSAQWLVSEHEFPGIREIRSSLESIEIACEECSVPDWPVDDG